ncbi:MAG: hypothetical protein EBX50_15615, partial [Chitinophagia bacterium]|nr:hypothetical protein [Chitinophagia bacterium]
MVASHKKYILFGLLLFIAAGTWYCTDSPVNYSSDIKPLLNKKCITCHGGVKKQGGFSLLFEEEALATTKSGKK